MSGAGFHGHGSHAATIGLVGTGLVLGSMAYLHL